MNPLLRTLILSLLFGLGLTSCDSVRDITDNPRYQTLIGRDVRTRVPMRLYNINAPGIPNPTPCELTQTRFGNNSLVGTLPPGQVVRFNQVIRWSNIYYTDDDLYGELVYKGKRYQFKYSTLLHQGNEIWLRLFDEDFDAPRPPPESYPKEFR
ncbi:hypothetical protein EI77_04283 [Prosthecobacter fusiformis]|uniref:Lipoprotein n=1 Tax=Prosthecobacter fusiformis TaxID=48464 RepID=A0A4R7RJC1_9BACT|nr:hypothetical protein [Prosthecobacter fusiformis]TDU64099.1 hypothetical protein EI77_04283 [Prosthecobacter fusiformis]